MVFSELFYRERENKKNKEYADGNHNKNEGYMNKRGKRRKKLGKREPVAEKKRRNIYIYKDRIGGEKKMMKRKTKNKGKEEQNNDLR